MDVRERRKLQKQGVQVPKDPAINIKLSELGVDVEQWQKEVLTDDA